MSYIYKTDIKLGKKLLTKIFLI